MLPAMAKLCCGISYPHLRSMTGTHTFHPQSSPLCGGLLLESERAAGQHDCVEETELSYQRQGQQALQEALEIVRDADGWRMEMSEGSGDAIYSKVRHGNHKVFRLEAELEASPEELYDILFVKVEEMHQWNPSIGQIKDGPTCIIIQPSANCAGKSRFTWLLNMDVKGWIPKSLVNQALPRAQLDFTKHLRRRLAAGGATLA
uniref:START domain-containing protein n=1 Tax=Pygocentrus nattereri TaxID=42514 RepID=A0AAR2KYC1_PYGNA